MTKSLMLLFAAGAVLTGASAAAQPAPPATEAPQTPAAAPAPLEVTDAELTAFAKGTVELHGLTDRSPEAMAAAITKTGLSVERYNEISARMKSDAAFQARANAALQAAVQANASTASSASPGQASAASPAPSNGQRS